MDGAQDWAEDTGLGLWKTKVTETHRNKKTQRPIVLYDATPEHPAQTQLITEDVLAGFWEKTDYSGAITATRKKQLLDKVTILTKAVVEAREEANASDAPSLTVGNSIFNYLFE